MESGSLPEIEEINFTSSDNKSPIVNCDPPRRITYRVMMGEYIIYYDGKVVGGIYDDRFLVKPTKSAVEMMPDANSELPYEGAKEMLLVDDVEDKVFLRELIETMYNELPAPKKKK